MVLLSESVDWTFGDYESKYADCCHVCLFNNMASDGWNAIMYDRRCVKRDTGIGGCNHRWNLMRSYRLGHLDSIRLLYVPLVRQKDKRN